MWQQYFLLRVFWVTQLAKVVVNLDQYYYERDIDSPKHNGHNVHSTLCLSLLLQFLMFYLEKMFLNESALRHLTTLGHHEGGDVLWLWKYNGPQAGPRTSDLNRRTSTILCLSHKWQLHQAHLFLTMSLHCLLVFVSTLFVRKTTQQDLSIYTEHLSY